MYEHAPIRAVIMQEGEMWSAHCVEYYIGAQGITKDEAINRLIAVVRAEAHETEFRTGKAFEGIPPAPDHIVGLWNSRSSGGNGEASVQIGASIELEYAEAA